MSVPPVDPLVTYQDDFTRNLFQIYEKVKEEGVKQV